MKPTEQHILSEADKARIDELKGPRTVSGVLDRGQSIRLTASELANLLAAARTEAPATQAVGRPCTCHPDDAVTPCAKRYAASECRAGDVEAIERVRRFAEGESVAWAREDVASLRKDLRTILALPPPPAEGSEPVAWTNDIQMSKLARFPKHSAMMWGQARGPSDTALYAHPQPQGLLSLRPVNVQDAQGLPSLTRDGVARAIGDTFSPNLTFDKSSHATQLACYRAADAILSLAGEGGEG